MKTKRPPAVVVSETPNLRLLARPRKRKLYGHTMIDFTIDLRRLGQVDGRKVPHPHGMGPGYYVANLDSGEQLKMWCEFQAILKGCVYRELTALGRALDVTYNTVLNWREARFNPGRAFTVLEVIAWAKNGKPMDKISQTWHGAEPVFHPDKVARLKALKASIPKVKDNPNPFDEAPLNPWEDDSEDN